jgi:branched-chain amino acid transport system substrate-binding protein
MRPVAACLLTLVMVLGLAGTARAAEPIKIGVFVSQTGLASYLGDPMAKTYKLEVERINQQGGLLGRPVRLIMYDDGSDPKQAVSLVRKLIEQDKVDFLSGGTLTGNVMAIIPLVQDAEIPYIALAAATAIVEPPKKWVFKASHTDRMAVDHDFADMQKRKISKIGVIAGAQGFDESCRKAAYSLAPKYGITIVADETYAPTDTDMTAQLTKIRAHQELQAVLQCGAQAPTVITVRNYQRLGMSKTPLYFTHAIASHEFITAAGSAAEGVRLAAPALLIAEQLPNKDPQKKPAVEFAKKYDATYHEPISTFGAHAKDALMIYVAAVQKAGTIDKAKVRDAIEQSKNVIGVQGIFTMSPTDHMGLSSDAFHMVEIRNGKWKLLY